MENNKGFSLIEVLITLVLTVIGILGMVAMQTKAIQYTAGSVTQSSAVILTEDLLEVLRSNRDVIYNNKNKLKDDSKYFKAKGESFDDLSCDTYGGFPSAENPEEQLCVWAKYAQALLPGVTNDVLEDNYYIENDSNSVRIGVAWKVKNGECVDSVKNDDGDDICLYSIVAEI